MKVTKQLTFDINQSRRIMLAAESRKLSPQDLLDSYKNVVNRVFEAWESLYGQNKEVSFQEYFDNITKYAELIFRKNKTSKDIVDLRAMANKLNDAIEEYKRDYKKIREIEEQLKAMGIEWV